MWSPTELLNMLRDKRLSIIGAILPKAHETEPIRKRLTQHSTTNVEEDTELANLLPAVTSRTTMAEKIHCMETPESPKPKYINDAKCSVRICIIGADVNLLPRKYLNKINVPQTELTTTAVKLQGYSGSGIAVAGKCYLKVNYKNKEYFLQFIIEIHTKN